MRALIVFLTLFLAAGVFAQPSKKTKDPSREKAALLFADAKAHYNIREYERAITGFKEAYLLAKEPVLLINIGQCYRFLGRYDEAASFLKTYLEEDPNTPYRAEVERLLQEVEAKESERAASAPASAPAQSIPAPQSIPATTAPEEEPRAALRPGLLYGMTASAFALGAGSGGLAIALAIQSRNLEDNDPPGGLVAAERSDRFALVAGGLVGAGVISGVVGYLVHRKGRKGEEPVRFEALLGEPR